MKENIVDKIKSRGYWEIVFRPIEYEKNAIKLPDCKNLIEKNRVELRGWDYPHFPQRSGDDTGLIVGDNFWKGWLDWEGQNHKEVWKFYQSTQFVHLLALREDWADWSSKNMWGGEKKIKAGDVLSVTGTIFQITEIFEFLKRLAEDGLYRKGATVTINLNNTEKRKLVITQFNRIPFSYDRKTGSANLTFERKFTQKEILEKSKDIALEVIIHFFEKFGWDNPNIDIIKTDQRNLLEGKI